MGDFLAELWAFMKERKSFLAAHHRDAGVVGKSYCAHAGSAVAPFIYVVLVSDVGIGTEISVPIVNEDSCAEIFVLCSFVSNPGYAISPWRHCFTKLP